MVKYVRSVLGPALAASLLMLTAGAAAAQEVNLYTTREPGLIKPLIDSFTTSTGITVNSIFVKDGLAERVAAEGTRFGVNGVNLNDSPDADGLTNYPIIAAGPNGAQPHAVPTDTPTATNRGVRVSCSPRRMPVVASMTSRGTAPSTPIRR